MCVCVHVCIGCVCISFKTINENSNNINIFLQYMNIFFHFIVLEVIFLFFVLYITQYPVGEGSSFSGIIDVVQMKLHKWNSSNEKSER